MLVREVYAVAVVMGIQHACFSQSDDPARYNVRHPRFYNWLLLIEIPCSVGSVLQFL